MDVFYNVIIDINSDGMEISRSYKPIKLNIYFHKIFFFQILTLLLKYSDFSFRKM